jgi:hypothetical protein
MANIWSRPTLAAGLPLVMLIFLTAADLLKIGLQAQHSRFARYGSTSVPGFSVLRMPLPLS